MADFTLSNGDDITFDLHKITIRAYRELLSPECPKGKEDDYLCKMIGWEVDTLLDLPQPEYQGLLEAFVKRISTPMADEKN